MTESELQFATELCTEKGDIIKALSEKLKNDTLSSYNASDYKSGSALCKPTLDKSQPDALVIIATFVSDKGEPYERTMYRACYVYPFDSSISEEITSRSGDYEFNQTIQFRIEPATDDGKDLDRKIRSGSLFNSSAEYGMEAIKTD